MAIQKHHPEQTVDLTGVRTGRIECREGGVSVFDEGTRAHQQSGAYQCEETL